VGEEDVERENRELEKIREYERQGVATFEDVVRRKRILRRQVDRRFDRTGGSS
jgi:hypothetical protein